MRRNVSLIMALIFFSEIIFIGATYSEEIKLNVFKVDVCNAPYNVKADGSDQVKKINKAVVDVSNRGGGTVLIPGSLGTVMVQALIGIQIKDNVTLFIGPGTTIKALPTDSEKYHVVYCANSTNWKIIGGNFIGDRDEHMGTAGEWGHIIQISGCKNYEIRDVTVKNAWGDGLYIGRGIDSFSENGRIINLSAENNRRQGISVISVKGLYVSNTRLENSNGTCPEAGLDFEPKKPDEILENIKVENLFTLNNHGKGIKIYCGRMINRNKRMDIEIINHVDEGSDIGFGVYGPGIGMVDGKIILRNPIYRNNKHNGIYIRNYNMSLAKLEIYNPKIINANRNNDDSLENGSSISVFADINDSGTEPLGNVYIYKPYIGYTMNSEKGRSIYVNDSRSRSSSNSLKNIKIDPITIGQE